MGVVFGRGTFWRLKKGNLQEKKQKQMKKNHDYLKNSVFQDQPLFFFEGIMYKYINCFNLYSWFSTPREDLLWILLYIQDLSLRNQS